jgi:hypothetical protein
VIQKGCVVQRIAPMNLGETSAVNIFMYRDFIPNTYSVPPATIGRKVKHFFCCLITWRKNIWTRLEERRIGNMSAQELRQELKKPYSLEAVFKMIIIWEKKNKREWYKDLNL